MSFVLHATSSSLLRWIVPPVTRDHSIIILLLLLFLNCMSFLGCSDCLTTYEPFELHNPHQPLNCIVMLFLKQVLESEEVSLVKGISYSLCEVH